MDIWAELADEARVAPDSSRVQLLPYRGVPILTNSSQSGLAHTRLPGRFEVVGQSPWIVLDAAQTPTATGGLMRTLDLLPFPSGRNVLLLWAKEKKIASAVMRVFAPRFREIRMVQAPEWLGEARRARGRAS